MSIEPTPKNVNTIKVMQKRKDTSQRKEVTGKLGKKDCNFFKM
jgi:hypothetical protein